jgi:hypothetical protein
MLEEAGVGALVDWAADNERIGALDGANDLRARLETAMKVDGQVEM